MAYKWNHRLIKYTVKMADIMFHQSQRNQRCGHDSIGIYTLNQQKNTIRK